MTQSVTGCVPTRSVGTINTLRGNDPRIGLKFLHRTTRSVTLTAEGEAYFDACQWVIKERDAAESGLSPRDRAP